jgi:hypothetical protein
MGLFSVRPKSVPEVQRQLAVHSVTEQAQWVGYNDNFKYIPYEVAAFKPETADNTLLKRFAYHLERTVVGPDGRRRVSDASLGQAALFALAEKDELQLSIIIPARDYLLAPVVEELLITTLEQGTDDGAVHTAIAGAILEVVHSTNT